MNFIVFMALNGEFGLIDHFGHGLIHIDNFFFHCNFFDNNLFYFFNINRHLLLFDFLNEDGLEFFVSLII